MPKCHICRDEIVLSSEEDSQSYVLAPVEYVNGFGMTFTDVDRYYYHEQCLVQASESNDPVTIKRGLFILEQLSAQKDAQRKLREYASSNRIENWL